MWNVVQAAGRIVVRVVRVFVRATDGLGSHGSVGPASTPTPPPTAREDYRP
ncbi:hypothetical protein [Curtobacterium luteum]|uniref:hypothetical protein n=1 Tax=Curtobacterium luteum TaxID=33881 RepID=UPI00381551F8